MSSSINRSVNIYINGEEIKNTVKDITAAYNKAKNSLNKLTIGSEEYVKKSKEVKQLKSILDTHTNQLKVVASSWERMAFHVKTIATGLIAGNLLNNFLQKLIQLLPTIVNKFSEFEKTLTNVFTLLNKTDMDKYSEQMQKGSLDVVKMGFSVTDTNKALFDAVSAGVAAGNSIEFLKEASRLSIGGVTDLTVAVNGGTTMLNGFKLEATETKNVMDGFFTAQKYGKTTVSELSTQIGVAVPIAYQLGITYQELLSAVATLTLSGISTSESVTYLKAAMSNLLKPTAEAEKVLRKYNIPLGTTEVKAAGFSKTLEQLNNLFIKNPDAVSRAITSTEAITAVSALSGNGLEKYHEILLQVNNDIGEGSSLDQAYAKQKATLAHQMAELKAKTTVYAIELGTKLLPAIRSVIMLFSGLAKKLMNAIDYMIEHREILLKIIKVIGLLSAAYLVNITRLKLLDLWTKKSIATNKIKIIVDEAAFAINKLLAASYMFLTGNIKGATQAIRILSATMKTTPIGLLIGLLATAAGAYILFKDSATEAKEAQKDFESEIKAGTAGMNTLFEQIKRTNEGSNLRKILINQLNTEYGTYLENLLTEKSTLKEIETAQLNANKALQANIAFKMQQEELETLTKKMITEEQDAFTEMNEYADNKIPKEALQEWYKLEQKYASEAFSVENYRNSQNYSNKLMDLYPEADFSYILYIMEDLVTNKILFDKKLKAIDTKYSGYLKDLQDPTGTETGTGTGTNTEIETGTGTETITDLEKKQIEIRKRYNIESLEDRKKLVKLQYAEDLKLYPEYTDRYAELQEAFKTKLLEAETEYNNEMLEAELKLFTEQQTIAELQTKLEGKNKIEQRKILIAYLEDKQEIYTQYNAAETAAAKEIENQLKELREEQISDTMDAEIKKLEIKRLYGIASVDELLKEQELLLEQQFLIDKKSFEENSKEYEELLEAYLKKLDELRKGKTKTDVSKPFLGLTEEEFETFKARIEIATEMANKLGNIWNSLNTIKLNQDKAAFDRYQNMQNKEREMLDQRLANGIISQTTYDKRIAQLEKNADARSRQYAIAQHKREQNAAIFDAMISVPAGIINIWEKWGAEPITASILTALFLGETYAQIAAIKSAEIPQYKDGGFTKGASLYIAGEAGKEWIAPNEMLNNPTTATIINDLERIRQGQNPQMLYIPKFSSPDFSAIQQSMQLKYYNTGGYTNKTPTSQNPNNTNVTYNYNLALERKFDILIASANDIKTLLANPETRKVYINPNALSNYYKDLDELNKLAQI